MSELARGEGMVELGRWREAAACSFLLFGGCEQNERFEDEQKFPERSLVLLVGPGRRW